MKQRDKQFGLAAAGASLGSVFIIKYLTDTEFLKDNIVIYVSLIGIWILFYLIIMAMLYNRFKKKEIPIPGIIRGIISLVTLGLMVGVTAATEKTTRGMLGRTAEGIDKRILPYFDLKILVCITIYFLVLLYLWNRYGEKNCDTKKDRVYLILSVSIMALAGYLAYMPFHYNTYVAQDTDAYFHSCLHYLYNQPLSYANASFYGHYGIFFGWFFAITRWSLKIAFAVLSLEKVIVYGCILYVLKELTDNGIIRLLGMGILLEYLAMSVQVYPQGYEHRTIFPALFMVLACIICKKCKRFNDRIKGFAAGYVLGIIGLVWCTDIGIISIVAWMVFHGYMILYDREKFHRLWFHILSIPVCGLLSVIISWQFVSLYNVLICHGASVSLRLFFYPLFEPVGISAFTSVISVGFYPWVFNLIFFLTFVGRGIAGLIDRRMVSKEKLYLLFIAVLGIGRMVYAVNRYAWGNLRLACEQEAVILLSAALLSTMGIIKQNKKTISQGICRGFFLGQVTLMAGLCCCMLLAFPNAFKQSYEGKYGDLAYDRADFAREFPENGLLIGRTALYIANFNIISESQILDVNFENCYDYNMTWDAIKDRGAVLFIGSAYDAKIFADKMPSEEVKEYYEEPYIWDSGNLSFTIYEPKE